MLTRIRHNCRARTEGCAAAIIPSRNYDLRSMLFLGGFTATPWPEVAEDRSTSNRTDCSVRDPVSANSHKNVNVSAVKHRAPTDTGTPRPATILLTMLFY